MYLVPGIFSPPVAWTFHSLGAQKKLGVRYAENPTFVRALRLVNASLCQT